MNNKLCIMCKCKRVCGEKENYKRYIAEMQEIDKKVEVDSRDFLCKEFIKDDRVDMIKIMKVAEYFKEFSRREPIMNEIYEKSLYVYGDKVKLYSYDETVDMLMNEPLELCLNLLNDLRKSYEVKKAEEANISLQEVVLDIVQKVTETYEAGKLEDYGINILSTVLSLSNKIYKMSKESEELLLDLETLEGILNDEELLSMICEAAKYDHKIITLLMSHIGYKVCNYLDEKHSL